MHPASCALDVPGAGHMDSLDSLDSLDVPGAGHMDSLWTNAYGVLVVCACGQAWTCGHHRSMHGYWECACSEGACVSTASMPVQ